jgi:hypothetical protein
MGKIIRKPIKNILEAPIDVIIQIAGNGLEKVVDNDAIPRLSIKCGSGIELDDDLAIRVKTGHGCGHHNDAVVVITGPGLVINNEQQVAVNPGNGVGIQNDQVVVKTGDGLGFDEANNVVVVPGDNLDIKDGKLTLDNEPVDCNCSDFTLMVNSDVSIKGHKLIFKRTYQDYQLVRNKAGLLLDFKLVNTRHTKQEIELPSDSGYVAMLSVPNREMNAKYPNFYKK